jgi:hypothetical protein
MTQGLIFMNACEITAAITALANAIACKLNDDELALVGAVLSQLGDTLDTIAAQRALCNGSNDVTYQ